LENVYCTAREKKIKIFDQLQFTYPLASMMDVQATREASSLEENIQHLKTLNFFTFCGGHFYQPASGIRISDADPDLAG
jgi:hypothetical protein